MFFFDPVYLLFALPGLLLAAWASFYTQATFKRFSQWRSPHGISGAQAAYKMLSSAGIRDVSIEETNGFLSDHYDPNSKTLRLSPSVYRGASLSAVGVACHEAGHAIQHAKGYAWLKMRTSLVPVTNTVSYLSYIVITLGFLFHASNMIFLGALLFSGAVLFSIVTLPVEWDASNRAKKMLLLSGYSSENVQNTGKVLNAAFLTYVAAAVSSLLTLAYYLLRSGLFSGRDD